jgi:hypothetical protein
VNLISRDEMERVILHAYANALAAARRLVGVAGAFDAASEAVAAMYQYRPYLLRFHAGYFVTATKHAALAMLRRRARELPTQDIGLERALVERCEFGSTSGTPEQWFAGWQAIHEREQAERDRASGID